MAPIDRPLPEDIPPNHPALQILRLGALAAMMRAFTLLSEQDVPKDDPQLLVAYMRHAGGWLTMSIDWVTLENADHENFSPDSINDVMPVDLWPDPPADNTIDLAI